MMNPNIPPILYKYSSSANGIKILSDLEIKITPPLDFNDPFDCNPSFGNPLDPSVLADPDDRHEQIAREYTDARAHLFGALCLSAPEERYEPLLWAYYADSHQGIRIGIDTAALLRHLEACRHLDKNHPEFVPVNYTKTRPNITPTTIDDDYHLSTMLFGASIAKSDAWKHEQEWRLILALRKFPVRIENQQPRFYARIPANVIQSITLGVHCSSKAKRCVQLILKQKAFAGVAIDFQEATLDEKTYALRFKNSGSSGVSRTFNPPPPVQ